MNKEANELIEHLHDLVDYWRQTAKSGQCTFDDAIEGVVFSTLVELDGDGQSMGYTLVSNETGDEINAGENLHEIFYK